MDPTHHMHHAQHPHHAHDMAHPMSSSPEEADRIRKQFFNDHAATWMDSCYKNAATGKHDLHARDFARLFTLVKLAPGNHVLDVGCGAGVLVPEILPRITSAGATGMLYELDFAEKMIEENRKRHRDANIRFITADAAALPLPPLAPASCDAVICFSCFPHLHDKDGALRGMASVLKPGGQLAIAHFISSEGIKKHHAGCHAVMHDHLPEEPAMRHLCERVGLKIETFIDEEGFYCLLATKR